MRYLLAAAVGALVATIGVLVYMAIQPATVTTVAMTAGDAGSSTTTEAPATTTPATTTPPAAAPVANLDPPAPPHLLDFRREALVAQGHCIDDGPSDADGAAIIDLETDLFLFAILERGGEYSDRCLSGMAVFMTAVGFDPSWSLAMQDLAGGEFESADGNYRAVVVNTDTARILSVTPIGWGQ